MATLATITGGIAGSGALRVISSPLRQPVKVVATVPTLWMRKPRLRVVKTMAQGYTAGKGWGQD